MKKIIFMLTFSWVLSLLGCKSEEEKFLENHKVILYDTKEAELFINNSVIKPMEASKIQEEFALKNNKAPEMYTFFIVDNYYVFTSYFQPKIPNASIKGIWVDATTGKAKYVLEDIRIRAYKPYTEKENAYPF